MRYLLISFAFSLSLTLSSIAIAMAGDGIVNVRSLHGVKVTTDRLETILKEKGMTIFSRIDHAAGAKSVGEALSPTQLLIFGNPKVGTQLMQCEQRMAIDLPLKALIFEDKTGQVWLSYNNPENMAKRHSMNNCGEVITKIGKALSSFAKAATSN